MSSATIILCFVLVLVGAALCIYAYHEESLRKEGAWLAVMFAGIILILTGLPPLLG